MKHMPVRNAASLIERAAELYDFGAVLRSAPAAAEDEAAAAGAAEPELVLEPPLDPVFEPAPEVRRDHAPGDGRFAKVDREALATLGFILPEAPDGALAEEFRIVKRQLLSRIAAAGAGGEARSRSILVCSGRAGEGKTFCAVNLALSLASEKDLEVLLVDGDFAKPHIPELLGIEAGPGLIDAIADPSADPEGYVIATDIAGLSILPAGRRARDVTELLASERTRAVLARLAEARPRRIIVFDSPPLLLASPASVLASHVGQAVVVVRADQTEEPDLRDAVALLSGCDQLSLMLNGAAFMPGGYRFGSYYGHGQ